MCAHMDHGPGLGLLSWYSIWEPHPSKATLNTLVTRSITLLTEMMTDDLYGIKLL